MKVKKQDVYIPVAKKGKDTEVLCTINGNPFNFKLLQDRYVLTEDELKLFANTMVNKLIDMIPVGDVTAFDMIKSVKEYCDNQDALVKSLTK